MYLVAESSLRELLSKCASCSNSDIHTEITVKGTWLKATGACSCGNQQTWSSQPWVGNRPLGNILFCSAILFSGVNIARALRMFTMMKVATLTRAQYFKMQRDYLFPAVNDVSMLFQYDTAKFLS